MTSRDLGCSPEKERPAFSIEMASRFSKDRGPPLRTTSLRSTPLPAAAEFVVAAGLFYIV
jgi:uncharacterized protein (DUF2461 family)